MKQLQGCDHSYRDAHHRSDPTFKYVRGFHQERLTEQARLAMEQRGLSVDGAFPGAYSNDIPDYEGGEKYWPLRRKL